MSSEKLSAEKRTEDLRNSSSEAHRVLESGVDGQLDASSVGEPATTAYDPDSQLYNSVLRCDERFHILRDTLYDFRSKAKHYSMVRDEHQRFELWIRFIGALAEREASLDYRLRLYPDIQELVLQMLSLLETSIDHGE